MPILSKILLVFLILTTANPLFLLGTIESNNIAYFLKLEDQRFDILILGNREISRFGSEMLTDSIILLSFEKNTGEIALFSLPRDLWVEIPGHGYNRINTAYVFGQKENPKGGGIKLAKKVAENVTGVKINNVLVVDLVALEKIVDSLGGIEIFRDKPFYSEEIVLKEGKNILDGKSAINYVVSRKSTSDFDRTKRHQEVILAIKDKVFSPEILFHPTKIWQIFSIVKDHIQTDLSLFQLNELFSILISLKEKSPAQFVFDDSNYLYSTLTNKGAYILLPRKGNFSDIRNKIRGVFQDDRNLVSKIF